MPERKHGGYRPGAGRPSIAPGEPSVSVPIRMTVNQREKLRELGGAPWVRKKIDEANGPRPTVKLRASGGQ